MKRIKTITSRLACFLLALILVVGTSVVSFGQNYSFPKAVETDTNNETAIFEYDTSKKTVTIVNIYNAYYMEKDILCGAPWLIPFTNIRTKQSAQLMEIALTPEMLIVDYVEFVLANSEPVKNGLVEHVIIYDHCKNSTDKTTYDFKSKNGKVTSVNGNPVQYDEKGRISNIDDLKVQYNAEGMITGFKRARYDEKGNITSYFDIAAIGLDSNGRMQKIERVVGMGSTVTTFEYEGNQYYPKKYHSNDIFKDAATFTEDNEYGTIEYSDSKIQKLILQEQRYYLDRFTKEDESGKQNVTVTIK